MKVDKNKIKNIKNTKEQEFDIANLLLDLAEKDEKINILEQENANILMELAVIKGGS
mgnify:CR=1 FL=1